MKAGNTIVALCSWAGKGAETEKKKKLTVTLSTSRLRGQCTNSGSASLEDFTIEASANPDWEVPDTLVYAGAQSLRATTKAAVPVDFTVPLTLTSYDWGGACTILLEAEDCTAALEDAPDDTDGDSLPDEFERAAKYYTAGRELKTFDPGKPKSDGLQAAADGDDDSDLDNRATPVHTKFGDGLTASEEYRAVKFRGAVRRTIDLDNDGPGGGKGGTHLKDIFIFDELKDTADPLFRSDNKFLEDYKLIWHLIDKGDMTTEEKDERNKKIPLAGFMDELGNKDQRAIWLHKSDMRVEFAGTRQLSATEDFSIKTGTRILVDVEYIARVATATSSPVARLTNWATAHEIGHKLGLRHNVRELTRQADNREPDPVVVTVFWITGGDKVLDFFVPMVAGPGFNVPLESFFGAIVDNEPPTPDDPIAIQGRPIAPGAPVRGKVIRLHDRDHQFGLTRVVMETAIADAARQARVKVRVNGHLRNLLDAMPHPADLEDVEKDPLADKDLDPKEFNPAQERLPDVKS